MARVMGVKSTVKHFTTSCFSSPEIQSPFKIKMAMIDIAIQEIFRMRSPL